MDQGDVLWGDIVSCESGRSEEGGGEEECACHEEGVGAKVQGGKRVRVLGEF
jgi:hypothetical protein